MARRTRPATLPSLTAEQALEVVRAKSARWAATYNPADGTVRCLRRVYNRRADGTIVGLSYGAASTRTVEERRPVVEVAAELLAHAAQAAQRAEAYKAEVAAQVARWRERAAELRQQAAQAQAELEGLRSAGLPAAVLTAAEQGVERLLAEADDLKLAADAA